MRLQDRISPPPRTPKGCSCGAFRPRHWLQKLYSSSSLRSDPHRFDLSCDRPYECRHLTCDSGGDHVLTFALCCKPAIPRAQSQLGIPRDLSDLRRQIGQPLLWSLLIPARC